MLRKNYLKICIILAVLAFTFFSTADAQKASIPRVQDRLALGEANVKQLLLLMETDHSGNVSKETYMKYMEAEFRRLDKSNQGELNARQLNQSPNLSASRYTGK
jgi:hypothetical protein